MKKIHSYKEIVEHFIKIIGNGTFQVETINESVLVKMLESVGITIPVEKSLRDLDKDYSLWLVDVANVANEGTECEHEAKGQDCGCREPKKIERLEEYDLLNFENLGFKINEIIDHLNKE